MEQVNGETYGPLKVLCEKAVERTMPGRVLTIRPGLIVGPHDATDRFSYWPHRIAQGGDVLAPGKPEQGTQFIDVRDLAAWNIRMVEEKRVGVYNADGPGESLTMGAFLETCKTVSGSDARFVWCDQAFLAEQNVAPWSELPLWVPDTPDMAGFAAFDCGKAVAAGLTFRPVADTVRDTLAWMATRPADHVWRAGLKPEREAEVLQAWRGKGV